MTENMPFNGFAREFWRNVLYLKERFSRLNRSCPFWFRKLTTDPNFLAPVYSVRMKHPQLKTYISALILDNYEYTPAAYVTMCIISP